MPLKKRCQLRFLLTSLPLILLVLNSGAVTYSESRSDDLLANSAVQAEPECEGNACASVSLTWDETKEQYKAQNNSAERWVRIEGANLVSNATLCLAPAKSDYLALKTIVGPFHADLAEEKCGKRTLGN